MFLTTENVTYIFDIFNIAHTIIIFTVLIDHQTLTNNTPSFLPSIGAII